MVFSETDKKFMKIALQEARKSQKKGDFPVGAVLVINGVIVGKGGNSMYSKKDWISHAENNLIRKSSLILKEKYMPTILNPLRNKEVKIELITTLEPCLMCLGSSILHRISRIVFACPDPHGGATRINPRPLSSWYHMKWPIIEGGLFKEESYELIVEFIKNQKEDFWKETLKMYEEMAKKEFILFNK